VADESPPHQNFSPESLGGGTVRLLLIVEDPESVVARAIAAGAKEVYPVGEEHGWRLGRIEDPFGHHWEIGRPLIAWPPAHGRPSHQSPRPPEVQGSLTDEQLVAVLQRYLTILQRHPGAEEMMREILTDDFETGFVGGHVWKGIDGLRDFLSQRAGFFDERHAIDALLDRDREGDELRARTRLHFFLRRWDPPSPQSQEFTGTCFHTWRVRRVGDEWRVAAQMVERFEDLNENSKRLFATPEEGLNR
jgi:hypothetical protein